MASKKKPSRATKKAPGKGPYIALAVLCENALEDKDGVTSLIRIVDTFKIRTQTSAGKYIPSEAIAALAPTLAPTLTFQVVIGIKAGNARGRRTLKIIPKTPSGKQLGETILPITLDGEKEPRGSMLRASTTIVVSEEGLYWIDVLLNNELVTKIPFSVIYEQVESSSSSRTSKS